MLLALPHLMRRAGAWAATQNGDGYERYGFSTRGLYEVGPPGFEPGTNRLRAGRSTAELWARLPATGDSF